MRIPLRPGKSTPDFVGSTLSVFGKNPHGEPNFRLIWSERKMIYFAGGEVPEYDYFAKPAWVLETWVHPFKFAGPEFAWNQMSEAFLGPYPRDGEYHHVRTYPDDWEPTVESVRLIAVGIEESRDVAMAQREEAIRRNLEQEKQQKTQKVADAIVELQDSASMGKIQQSVTGPKNNFRTPEDFEREHAKVSRLTDPRLPKHGGKIIQ